MKDWITKRRVSLAVHALLLLIPVVAALVAGFDLWTWVLGSGWLAVPVIVSLEGVAAIGFALKLARIDSPLVKARHIIPWYSLGTLTYVLGEYLMTRLDVYAAVGFTAFLVAVFGTLFVQLFGTVERLFITEVEAAKERATSEMHAILVRVERFNAESAVFNEATLKLRQAEQERFDVMQHQQLLGLPGGSNGALLDERNDLAALLAQSENEESRLRTELNLRTRELEHAQDESAKRGRVIASLAQPKNTVTIESSEGELHTIEMPRSFDLSNSPELKLERQLDTVADIYAPALVERIDQEIMSEPSWTLNDLLEDAGITVNAARLMVKKYTDGTVGDVYSKLNGFGYVPAGMELDAFKPLFGELMAEVPVSLPELGNLIEAGKIEKVTFERGGPATATTVAGGHVYVETGLCGICGVNPLKNSDKSVSRKPVWKAALGGKDACKDCRTRVGA